MLFVDAIFAFKHDHGIGSRLRPLRSCQSSLRRLTRDDPSDVRAMAKIIAESPLAMLTHNRVAFFLGQRIGVRIMKPRIYLNGLSLLEHLGKASVQI